MKKIGSEDWFKDEAIKSISKISDKIWDYSNSSVLYTPQTSSAYEEAQKDEEDSSYKKVVTDEESLFIQQIAPDIVRVLPNDFIYLDLGPGTEHKEKSFQDSALLQKKSFLYVLQ